LVHVREVDVVLVVRAEGASQKLLPGVLLRALLELPVVEASSSAYFLKVQVEAPLMEAMVDFRSRALEEHQGLVQGVLLVEVRQAGFLTSSQKGLVDITFAEVALEILEQDALVGHGF